MPNGDKSFYTDIENTGNYYRFISEELPRIVCELLPISARREDNFIGGLSMGGYGALKAGLRSCDKFSAVIALSPCGDIKNLVNQFDVMKGIFGPSLIVPDADDVLYLAERCENKPRVFMAIGTQDFLYDNNKPVREKLAKLNYDFTYCEGPGTHSWDFWDEYIEKALVWLFK